MFTGIVEAIGMIQEVAPGRLGVQHPPSFTDISEGSSVAVAGVCLTVASLAGQNMLFDVVPETLSKTILGRLHPGDRVNLERALPAGGRFEGHIVQGHVEGVGRVTEMRKGSLTVVLPNGLLPSVVEKGSIAIDGVSLTVANLRENCCTIALVPHTLAHTTLGFLKPADPVNVETDILARYAYTPSP